VPTQNKILQGLAIPHTALISVIFCLMVLSFPTGAYLVFNSEIGDDITYKYPMDSLSLFLAGIGFEVPVKFELGDGFVVIWCTFYSCNIRSKKKFCCCITINDF